MKSQRFWLSFYIYTELRNTLTLANANRSPKDTTAVCSISRVKINYSYKKFGTTALGIGLTWTLKFCLKSKGYNNHQVKYLRKGQFLKGYSQNAPVFQIHVRSLGSSGRHPASTWWLQCCLLSQSYRNLKFPLFVWLWSGFSTPALSATHWDHTCFKPSEWRPDYSIHQLFSFQLLVVWRLRNLGIFSSTDRGCILRQTHWRATCDVANLTTFF